MSRTLVTNADLTKMINNRFREGKELDGDCPEVKISGAHLYPKAEETKCNWDMYIYDGPPECGEVFHAVIEEFRLQYNLSEE